MKHLMVWISVIIYGGFLLLAGLSTAADLESVGEVSPRSEATHFTPKTDSAVKPFKTPDLSSFPIQFIPNLGQEDPRVMYYAKTSRYTLWVTPGELVFGAAAPVKAASGDLNHPPSEIRHISYSLRFIGANSNVLPVAEGATGQRVNYLLGSDPQKWKTDIPASAAVVYKNLYKGVDLKIYGIEKKVEYDWIVNAGSAPDAIVMEFKDVSSMRINDNGDLAVQTALGEIIHQKPVAYQMENNRKVPVNAEYRRIGRNRIGFKTGAWDPRKPLVIDPVVLTLSGFLGGNGSDYAVGVCCNSLLLYYYVAGNTYSSNFPQQYGGCRATTAGNLDVFVAAVDHRSGGTVFMTFLGGSGNDRVYSVTDDPYPDYIWLAGETDSLDFPLRNPIQSQLKGAKDGFIVKMDGKGVCPQFSTYLGGYGEDSARSVACNGDDRYAYITGKTTSSDFPLLNPFQSNLKGLSDAFICKIKAINFSSSPSLQYSTYLGGNQSEEGHGIAVDSADRVYITGYTNSFNFPVKNGIINQAPSGLGDAFVTQLSATGNSLVYSTYLGGASGWEEGNAITLDSENNIYVVGSTSSSNFVPPSVPAYDRLYNGYIDVFVTKLMAGGQKYGYSTYVGGYHNDYGLNLAIGGVDNGLYVVGYTLSSNFPVKNGITLGQHFKEDAFMFKLSPTGALSYSTLMGGVESDIARGVCSELYNRYIIVVGETFSYNFPTVNSFHNTIWGGYDAFFSIFSIY